MSVLEDLVAAVLSGDALAARSASQDLLRQTQDFSELPAPENFGDREKIVAAALVEWLAEANGKLAPSWTSSIAGLESPLYLVASALTMPNLRKLCDEESPEPLKTRNLFAPPNYLISA